MVQQKDTTRQHYRLKYLAIAENTEWLLENGLNLRGCHSIARKYKELFMEKRLTTAQGVRYSERVRATFSKYYEVGFLKQLFPEEKNPLYWVSIGMGS